MIQCSICLSGFREPVCIPCGHVYCKRCLSDHVNAPANNRLTAKCPGCRASFELVAPDLTYLPEKYHKFVTNNVRRIYVDFSSADKELRESLKAAEARLARKSEMEQALLKRCEELTEVLIAHRQGERDANQRILELEDDVMTLEKLVKENNDKVKDLQKRHGLILDKAESVERNNQVLQKENIRLSLSYHDMGMKLNENESVPNTSTRAHTSDPKQKQRKYVIKGRTPSNAQCTIRVSTPEDTPVAISMSTSDTSVASVSTSGSTVRRPIKPLPKRRSGKNRRIGDSSFMAIDISDFV